MDVVQLLFSAGLKRLGTFPSEVPYHSQEFYQELEDQYSSLLLAAQAALSSMRIPSEGDHRLFGGKASLWGKSR